MILKKASYKAIEYACMKFHYAKSIPVNVFGYSVFEKDEWCGCIVYGTGANNNIANPYDLKQGQVIELVRMALNGEQSVTSKALSISLKLVKKDCPLVKLIVSYADVDQNHEGIIYQATNWYFTGHMNKDTTSGYIIHGKKTHNKTVYGKGVIQSLKEVRKHLDPNAEKFITKGKLKYIYPIDKSLTGMCEELSKPYSEINASLA